jgi:Sigma-70, region 4
MTTAPCPVPNAAPKPDHRRLPRKKRQPSERDQALFNLRQAKGWTQERIAKEHRLSQSRVSQILRRVAAWREAQQPGSGAELAGEEERHERRLERARHQEMYERSLREFDSVPPEWTSVRRIHRGQAVVCETTTRQQMPSVQWLKVAQRASEALTRPAATTHLPEEASQLLEHAEQLRQMTSVLAALCSEADAAAQRLNLLEAVLGAAASNASNLTPPESAQVAAPSQLGEESSAKNNFDSR